MARAGRLPDSRRTVQRRNGRCPASGVRSAWSRLAARRRAEDLGFLHRSSQTVAARSADDLVHRPDQRFGNFAPQRRCSLELEGVDARHRPPCTLGRRRPLDDTIAGLAPERIRAMYSAARRDPKRRSGTYVRRAPASRASGEGEIRGCDAAAKAARGAGFAAERSVVPHHHRAHALRRKPTAGSVGARSAWRLPPRQIGPRRSCPQHPKHSVEDVLRIAPRPAALAAGSLSAQGLAGTAERPTTARP